MPRKYTIPMGIEVLQCQGEKAMDKKVEIYLADGWYFKDNQRRYASICGSQPAMILALMYKDCESPDEALLDASI